MGKANELYTIKSNAKEYIEKGYQKAKKEVETLNPEKEYTRIEFFTEVADFCGVSMATISQIHARNLKASYLTAIKISEFLGEYVADIWEVVELNDKMVDK